MALAAGGCEAENASALDSCAAAGKQPAKTLMVIAIRKLRSPLLCVLVDRTGNLLEQS
jgi:hypothetical protein